MSQKIKAICIFHRSALAIALLACSTVSLAISIFDSEYQKTCRWPLSEPKNEIDCTLRANNGDVAAEFALAEYNAGKGNYDAAMSSFKVAALQGHDQAIEHVRIALIKRANKSSNPDELIDFLRKVVDVKGLDNRTRWVTQHQICGAYANPKGLGINASPDYKSAVYWCEQSTKNGGAKAAWDLVRLHKFGLGVPKDSKKAEVLWQEFLARDVMPIVADDPESVVGWHRDAADIGICSATKRLAEIYEKGLYKVVPSIEKSQEWHQKHERCKTME